MKFLILALSAVVFAPAASAVEIMEESTWCMTRKSAMRYDKLVSMENKTFVQRMLDRAECVERAKGSSAVVISRNGGYARLETPEGVRVWVREDRLKD